MPLCRHRRPCACSQRRASLAVCPPCSCSVPTVPACMCHLQVLDQSRSPKGGLKVKSASGNAAKAGIAAGDTVIYTSSFFGDELW